MDKCYYTEKSGIHREGILIHCASCGKKTIARTRKDRVAKYCSPKCAYIGKSNKILVICFTCKKEFFIVPSKLKNSKSGLNFCSRKCKDLAQTLKFGCREIMPPAFGNSKGREKYKNLIKNHEKPICVDCGELKVYLLNVHHKDGNNKNNKESNFEIVCYNCHIKRHLRNVNGKWIYSTKFLTPRELLDKL